MEGAQLAEFGQAGAVLLSQTPVSENVSLVINQEVVGKARLCVYEGRFAIEVL
jgi:flagellar motor switch/type III secretory pathway protein FliN